MKTKCTTCGKELMMYSYGECYDCKTKSDIQVFLGIIALCAIVFLLILGGRFLWAKYVFNDYRCALSECRIIKD